MNLKKQKYEAGLCEKVEAGIVRVLNKFDTTVECAIAFNSLFENISQIFEHPQGSKYSLNKILKGNEFFSTEKEFLEEEVRLFVEFIEYSKAPGGFVIAVSTIKIDETLPVNASLFVLKEEMIEKFSKT